MASQLVFLRSVFLSSSRGRMSLNAASHTVSYQAMDSKDSGSWIQWYIYIKTTVLFQSITALIALVDWPSLIIDLR